MLTRLLYIAEDVKQNIVYCIVLNHKKELSYWLAEYYYSGYKEECMEWLTQIYYIHYALKYPSFEKVILLKRDTYKSNNDYDILINIANNLRIKESSSLYNTVLFQQNIIHRGRKPLWLQKYDESLRILLFYYSKADWLKVYNELQKCDREKLNEFYNAVCVYLNDHQPIHNDIVQYYYTISTSYSIDTLKVMIFAMCLHMSVKDTPIISEYGKWLPNKNIINDYITLSETEYPRDMLKNNVHYNTRTIIEKKDLLDILNNWIEYSYETPIWRERIEYYGGSYNTISKKVEFPNDELLEEYYDTYGYELDEQSNDIYNKLYSVSLLK